jgi:hypothetical protein
MNSNRPERQTDDDVLAIKSGLMLPNIQTHKFSVGDESIHFQHNLKVLVRFPKSHSVQSLVVSWVYLKVINFRKTLHYCHKKRYITKASCYYHKKVKKIKLTARSFDIILFSWRKDSEECISRNIYRDAVNIPSRSTSSYDNQLKINLCEPAIPRLS